MSVNIKVTGELNIEWGQIDPKVTGGLNIRQMQRAQGALPIDAWTCHTDRENRYRSIGQ